MKIAIVMAAVIGLGLLTAGVALAGEAERKYVRQFTVGECTVVAILDRSGAMKAEIFHGPLNEEQKLAYMPGGQAPSSVNIFLIKGPAGNILVDAGWGGSGPGEDRFAERLKEAGLTPGDIDVVLLTHMHPDHIGGLLTGSAPAFAKARVLVSKPELDFWSAQAGAKPAPVKAAEPAAPAEAVPTPSAVEEAMDQADNAGLASEEAMDQAADGASAADAADAPPPAADPAPAPAEAAEPAEGPLPPADLPGAVIAAYQGRLETFDFDRPPVPGITALNAVGHTPGHTAFLLESGEAKLLFIGDLIHAAALQFPQPDECATYDRDPLQAVASRRALLDRAIKDRLPVAGAHIPFTGLGWVQADDRGGCTGSPAQRLLD